jgi:predicted methyltransferase
MKSGEFRSWIAALAFTALAGCAALAPAPDYPALLASADRSEADRNVDKRRNPVDLLRFYDVRSGMTVADIGAFGGYNAELLARAVGASGRVYAHNPPAGNPRMADRMKSPVMQNVVIANRPFDDPLPPEARNIDLVVFNFAYHDTANMDVDRAKMNRAIFAALKNGGLYIVADHSGRAGTGTAETKTLHRIDEAAVRSEIEAAGFRLVGEGGFLRNPQDPRTAPSGKNSVPNDEFVLKFVKP